MRILGFSKHWPKLDEDEFTTFRFPRRDKDWQEGEMVQVVIKPRSKNREFLGYAQIIKKEERWMGMITEEEARADGFDSFTDMYLWLRSTYHDKLLLWPMNKLTLHNDLT